ncbi:MAG: L-serine ammonia-lyase, iron-sulfur-dependent, subunit alpha [Candidatus Sericytochromatia bacterium]|nr:L-serine ammonia-lyase, iron-sulfur-dependent, subunit alpha [Candidatus Tanganyikabacteria bacterium]
MSERDYRFESIADLVDLAEAEGIGIGEVALRYEVNYSGRTREDILATMRTRWDYMKQSMQKGMEAPEETMGAMSLGAGQRLGAHKPVLLDDTSVGQMARALAVNECSAAMRRIVAAPTAGSSGILPSALWGGQQRLALGEDAVINGLFVAGAIGMVVANNATISGAKGGCMAEVGVSACMAAGALVEMAGGAPGQVAHAMAIALKNTLGLVCDPIGGYVEVPCIKRNALFTMHATVAAELALAGIESFVPADQVVAAMRDVGDSMPRKLKETSLGGLATTQVGLEVLARRKSVS